MMKQLISLLALSLLAACGDDDGGTDGQASCQAVDGVRDSGVRESAAGALQAYEEVATDTWEPRAVDSTACVDAVPSTPTCTFVGQVKDFEDDIFLQELAGTTVKLFPENRIDDVNASCTPAGTTATSVVCWVAQASATGAVEFPNITCGKKFALWAFKESPVVPVTKPAAEFDRVVLEGATAVQPVTTISVATYNLVPGIVGFSPDPTLGIVAGQVRDCVDNGIANLTAHIAAGALTAPPAGQFCGDDPMNRVGTFYFIDNFPTRDQIYTSEDGLWAFVNVPPGPLTVFAFGRRAAGGAYELLGSTQLASLPDTITIGDVFVR